MKWDLIKGIKIFKVIEHFKPLYIYSDLTTFERQKLNEIDRRINEQKATKSHPEIQIERKSDVSNECIRVMVKSKHSPQGR